MKILFLRFLLLLLLLISSIRRNTSCRTYTDAVEPSRPLTVPASSLGGLWDVAAVLRFPVTVTLLEMRITVVCAARHMRSHGYRLI